MKFVSSPTSSTCVAAAGTGTQRATRFEAVMNVGSSCTGASSHRYSNALDRTRIPADADVTTTSPVTAPAARPGRTVTAW